MPVQPAASGLLRSSACRPSHRPDGAVCFFARLAQDPRIVPHWELSAHDLKPCFVYRHMNVHGRQRRRPGCKHVPLHPSRHGRGGLRHREGAEYRRRGTSPGNSTAGGKATTFLPLRNHFRKIRESCPECLLSQNVNNF